MRLEQTMQTLPPISMVLFVSNVARVSDFYKEVIGMEIRHQEDSHTALQTMGFELIIHAMYGDASEPDSPDKQLVVREEAYSKLCLPVANIEQARELAHRFGGSIKAAEHEWSAQGICACDGHDPEGNVIQVRMFAS
jgi:predicted enzyme related to lactoylglutathione lyase